VGAFETSAEQLSFKGSAEREGTNIVSGRITLVRYNLADKQANLASVDQQIVKGYRQEWERLWHPQ